MAVEHPLTKFPFDWWDEFPLKVNIDEDVSQLGLS
jgi:hypothetical protein